MGEMYGSGFLGASNNVLRILTGGKLDKSSCCCGHYSAEDMYGGICDIAGDYVLAEDCNRRVAKGCDITNKLMREFKDGKTKSM